MTLVNHGFNGSLDEASFAQMMGIAGSDGVDGSAAWAVTQGAGRQVSVAASSGWAAAAGVSSKDDTGAITASLSTPVAGQWYLITRRIDWSAHTCTVQAIAHTTTTATIPTLPPTTYPTYNQTPGTLYDQPLAWAWVRNTDTTMALFDLRALPARTRLAALEAILVRNVADLDALVTYDPTLTEGRILNVDELNADFQAQDGVWVQITPARFATSGARDTAYAKASAAFKVAGAQVRRTDKNWTEEWTTSSSAWCPVAGQMPYVQLTSAKSVANNTVATVGLVTPTDWGYTEVADAQNWHDPATTPNKIIPTIPGRYRVTLNAAWAANSTGLRYGAVGLNGVYAGRRRMVSTAVTDGNGTAVVTVDLTMNGTTDYIDITTFQTSGGALAMDLELMITYLGAA